MDTYENKRRDFLKKLGLIAGATIITASGISKASGIVSPGETAIKLSDEQETFLSMYEKWLDQFHGMAKAQKNNAEDLENNKKLMSLSEEAGKWQKKLVDYMTDENFARRFMLMTERVTNII